jgi:exopolyphosphatase/pppGpp-phosphohydrolase
MRQTAAKNLSKTASATFQVTLYGQTLDAVRNAAGTRRPLSHGVKRLLEAKVPAPEHNKDQDIPTEQLSTAVRVLVDLVRQMRFELDAIRAERRDWIAAGEAALVTIAKTNFGLR